MIRKVTNNNLDVMMDYVKKEPAINLFIIGDVEQFGLDTDFLDVYLQYRDEEITACLLRYYRNVVIYSHADYFDTEEIINLMNTIDYSRLGGKKTVMDRIIPYLTNVDKSEVCYFCKLEHDLNLEDNVTPIKKATIEDLPRLHDLMQMVGFDPINYIESNTNKLNNNAGRIYFQEDGDLIISSASTSIETSVSAMVGGVGTHINYRNKGYASQVVSKLCKDLLDEGKTPCLFFYNPQAGSIYHRLGFKDIDMWTMVKINDHQSNE